MALDESEGEAEDIQSQYPTKCIDIMNVQPVMTLERTFRMNNKLIIVACGSQNHKKLPKKYLFIGEISMAAMSPMSMVIIAIISSFIL